MPLVCGSDDKCTTAPGLGQACTGQCDNGLQCASNDGTTYVCKAPGAVGDSCSSDGGGSCGAGLFCNSDGKCAVPVCK